MGKPNYVNLTSFSDVRRFIAKLINQRRNDEISSAKFKDLVYGSKALQDVLEAIYIQTEVETRLERLENAAKGSRFGAFPRREPADEGEPKEHKGTPGLGSPEGH